MRDRILGGNPHVYVWNTKGIVDYHAEVDKLRRVSHVIGAAPAILGQGLISAAETAPVVVKGIDPALEQQVTDIKGAMVTGSVEALAPAAAGEALTDNAARDGILIGSDLAKKLGVAVGDTVTGADAAGDADAERADAAAAPHRCGWLAPFPSVCTNSTRPTAT